MRAKPNTRLRIELQVHGEWSALATRMQPRRFNDAITAKRWLCANLRWTIAKLEGDEAAATAANTQALLLDPLTETELRERVRAEQMAGVHAAFDEYSDNIVERFCAKQEAAP